MAAQTGWASHNPIIPATPAKTGGAGIGILIGDIALIDRIIRPKVSPTDKDSNISFIFQPLLLVLSLYLLHI